MFGKDKKAPAEPPAASHGLKAGADEKVHMSAPPRIGLALGSGLARGFAHLGVVRALKRHGIEPTIISGTSMGALVGGAYLANRLDAVEEWAYTLTKFKVLSYLDFRVKASGLIGGERLMKLMLDNFGDIRVEDLPHPFIAITADLVTGHEVWLRKGRLVDVMRASFSLPGIFPPMHMNNRWLIDGALVNPVPVSACTATGARMTIAVNVSGDIIGKARRPGDTIPTVAGFDLLNFDGPQQLEEAKKASLIQRVFRREPNSPSIFGVMVSALNIVQDRLARSRLAGDPPDVLIVPRIGHIGLMEFDRAEELIAEGEAAVERAMPDIKAAYSVLCTNYTEDDGVPDYPT
ncbi:MAG TPA: patatin-like phospholipase family protein [Patescibacteria group bacterium]|nr:patatin-like phospholipase family protein [Patescibacteria group bacterium]